MKECKDCGELLPYSKYNSECNAPDSCFKCRVKSVNVGFGGFGEAWHGDTLVGGTLASDNRHTVEMARAQGHDPVPVGKAPAGAPSASQMAKLKTAIGG